MNYNELTKELEDKLSDPSSLVIIAGGVGAAKVLDGIYRVLPVHLQRKLNIIVNTGDDTTFFGLHISPDIDTIIYHLADVVNRERHWGINKDTFTTLRTLERFYGEQWFNLGDMDLATHIFRTDLLRKGKSLTEATIQLKNAYHINANIYPMTDELAPTILLTDIGRLSFQEYFVKYKWKPTVKKIEFPTQVNLKLSEKLEKIIKKAWKIVIAPSNPFLSIDPIINIKPIRELLRKKKKNIVAISPIVGGKALKGPTRNLMETFNIEPTVYGYYKYYKDFIGTLIIDQRDKEYLEKIKIRNKNVEIKVLNTVVPTVELSKKFALNLFEKIL